MTKTITLPRSVLEQALEALDESYTDTRSGRELVATLRAALEQDHPEQHLNMVPKGWALVPKEPTPDMLDAIVDSVSLVDFARGSRSGYRAMLAAAPQPPALEQPQVEQEPICWVTGYYGGRCTVEPYNGATVLPVEMALYTRPQPKREPLTDEAERQCPYPKANPSTRDAWLDGWEAAEREHGIGGEAKTRMCPSTYYECSRGCGDGGCKDFSDAHGMGGGEA